jgi:glc operon protein GlcG
MNNGFYLSCSDSIKIIQSILAEQEKMDRGIAIAVVDAHGELLAFQRTDGCGLPFIKVAKKKAYTAAREGRESKAVGDFAKAMEIPVRELGDPNYVGWGGGTPIFCKGQLVGAVGVSGLTEEEDMKLSTIGARAMDMA